MATRVKKTWKAKCRLDISLSNGSDRPAGRKSPIRLLGLMIHVRRHEEGTTRTASATSTGVEIGRQCLTLSMNTGSETFNSSYHKRHSLYHLKMWKSSGLRLEQTYWNSKTIKWARASHVLLISSTRERIRTEVSTPTVIRLTTTSSSSTSRLSKKRHWRRQLLSLPNSLKTHQLRIAWRF